MLTLVFLPSYFVKNFKLILCTLNGAIMLPINIHVVLNIAISMLTTCTYIVRQVCTFEPSFFSLRRHRRCIVVVSSRPEGRHLVIHISFLLFTLISSYKRTPFCGFQGLLSESPCRMGGIPQHSPIKADYPRLAKAFYRQGQRQQFQPHFTCGRLVALQCSIHNTSFLSFCM